MKVLVVDLDNTLFNTQARYNACLAEQGITSLESLHGEARRKFWECYQSPRYMDFDLPNRDVLSTVKKAKEKGWTVVPSPGGTVRHRERKHSNNYRSLTYRTTT